MDLVVWVDAWQLQCCGEPFTVGDRVRWTLTDVDAGTRKSRFGADRAEEHHGRVPDDAPVTVGTVASIEVVRSGDGPPVRVETADGLGEPPFHGYLVRLTGVWESTG